MKILTPAQLREADRITAQSEDSGSIAIMERAAEAVAGWLCNNVPQQSSLLLLVGKGNNGGDALAVARIMYHAGWDCSVVMPLGCDTLSIDCAFNLKRLPKGVGVSTLLPAGISSDTVIVDALLGTGVSVPLNGALREVVEAVNALPCRRISIDMPSGMLSEFGNKGRLMIHAHDTLTIEMPKLAQLLPEAGECCGRIEVVTIGLDEDYIASTDTPYHYIDEQMVRSLLRPRAKFSHKGTYGHTLLVCGGEGMVGAAVLSAGGALRSGCGLVTVHLPRDERHALQANYPSAMVSADDGRFFSQVPADLGKYASMCVGPGLGSSVETVAALGKLLCDYQRPLVADADALNIMAAERSLLETLPRGSVLTPHPGELRRLVGEWSDDADKLMLTSAFAAQYGVYVVVKGAHTMICTPDGRYFFNSTAAPGMAKGGAGDVLAGFVAGLMARGYRPLEASIIGVFAHGRAGEKAAEYYGVEGMMSSEIVDFLAEALHDME